MEFNKRHRYILLKAYWEGTVNRADLIEKFDISPAQATSDFKQLLKDFPLSVVYDTSKKRYRPDVRITKYVDAYSFDEYYASVFALEENAVEVLAHPRRIDKDVYGVVHEAIAAETAILVEYQSLNDPTGSKVRTLFPHSIVNSGFRWHVRAYEVESKSFKDFNLSRIKTVKTSQSHGVAPDEALKASDSLWNTNVTLMLTPNMGFSEEQRAVVAKDYMSDGSNVITLIVRASLLLYVLHMYEVRDFSEKPPMTQLLQIGNLSSVSKYLPEGHSS